MLSKDLPNEELVLDDMVNLPNESNGDNLGLEDILNTSEEPEQVNDNEEKESLEGTEETPKEELIEEEGVQPEESTKEESTEGDSAEDILGDILSGIDSQEETVEDVKESTDTVIEKTEEVKEAVENGDLTEAVSLLEEMNTELISVKADLGKYETEASIYKDKLAEVNKELSETKANYIENPTIDNAHLAKLNRMYIGVLDGNEGDVAKVKKTLEDMYYAIAGESFEDKEVGEANAGISTKVSLGELSSPTIEAKPKKEKEFNANQGLDMEDFLG